MIRNAALGLWVRRLMRFGALGVPGALVALVTLAAFPAAALRAGAPAGGDHEGISVHGDWLIEVYEPDGTLVTQRAFKNALANYGGLRLAEVLARKKSVGKWGVLLAGSPFSNSPCHTTGSGGQTFAAACVAVEPSSGLGEPAWHLFPTLSIDAEPFGPYPEKLHLKGTVTADRNGTIDFVNTVHRWCPATSAPSNPCTTGSTYSLFTTKTLSPGVQVSAGQQVAITVLIGFS